MLIFLVFGIVLLEISRIQYGKASDEYRRVFEFGIVPSDNTDYKISGLDNDSSVEAWILLIFNGFFTLFMTILIGYSVWTLNFDPINQNIWTVINLAIFITGLYCNYVTVRLIDKPRKFYNHRPLAIYKSFRYLLYGICIVFILYIIVSHYIDLLTPTQMVGWHNMYDWQSK